MNEEEISSKPSTKDTILGWFRRYQVYLVMILIGLVFTFGNIWWALLVMALIIGGRLYLNWETLMMGARQIEFMLWGKPLEKQYWTKEQWENRPRFSLFKDFKLEWIPSSISQSMNMPFRFALYMSVFSFSYFAIGFFIHYRHINYFASLFYVSGIFIVTFILLQVMAAAKVIYERKRKTKDIGSTGQRQAEETSEPVSDKQIQESVQSTSGECQTRNDDCSAQGEPSKKQKPRRRNVKNNKKTATINSGSDNGDTK